MCIEPKFIKRKLETIIKQMNSNVENFVRSPKKDFTRKRKLNFSENINLILAMGGESLNKELLKHFNYEVTVPTASAFVQQREKILPEAFKYLFENFTNSFTTYKKYTGYRLLAVDGSKFNISHNPTDTSTYVRCKEDCRGFNRINLNALFDLENKIYTDVTVQSIKECNEHLALTDMIDKSTIEGKVIVIADRGYESYNNFAHIEQKGWKYVIRVRDIHSKCMSSSLKLPSTEEFDEQITLKLTRRQTNEIKANPDIYKFMPKNSKFDYLVAKSSDFYNMSFRVVRVKIAENSYETLITNLDKFKFPTFEIKKLYNIRWGIETSFRKLKYSLALINFHSKKLSNTIQEVFAKVTMYNFCELMISSVVISKKEAIYEYQVNFTIAVKICIVFFRNSIKKNGDIKNLIGKYLTPIRDGRTAQRNLKAKSFVSFVYRVA